MQFTNYVAFINGTDADDIFDFLQGAGQIFTGNGNDTVKVAGYVNSIDTGAGSDLVQLGSAGAGTVSLGDGTNTLLANGGYIGTIDGGAGTDFISTTGSIGTANLGAGDDQIFATGKVNVVNAGHGIDNINVGGTDKTDLGAGNDIFRSTAWAGEVIGGDGDDHMTLLAGGRAFGGNGNDTVVAEGDKSAWFDGGEGNDTFAFDFDGQAEARTFVGGNGHDTAIIDLDGMSDAAIAALAGELSARHGDFDGHFASINATFDGVEHVALKVDGETFFV